MSGNLNDYIAGAVGGVSGLIIGHPLDTFKVILQTRNMNSAQVGAHQNRFKHMTTSHLGVAKNRLTPQTHSKLREQWNILQDLNKQGLARGFFRGLGFPLYSYAFINSTYFGVYGTTLKWIENSRWRKPGSEGRTPRLMQGYWAIYWAGCCGGLAQCFLVCPAELVKVVLQSQATNATTTAGRVGTGQVGYFTGPIEATRWILKHRGPLGFYRGFSALLVRDVPTFGFYIVVYEVLREHLLKSSYADSGGIWPSLIAGGMSGVITWTLAVPSDVIKSRLQADVIISRYSSTLHCCREVWRQQGPRGFTTGLGVVCLRAFPVNAVTFLAYTKSLDYLTDASKACNYE